MTKKNNRSNVDVHAFLSQLRNRARVPQRPSIITGQSGPRYEMLRQDMDKLAEFIGFALLERGSCIAELVGDQIHVKQGNRIVCRFRAWWSDEDEKWHLVGLWWDGEQWIEKG